MLRRIFKWLAIMSLGFLGTMNCVSLIITRGTNGGGWHFYNPYSDPSPWEMNFIINMGRASQVFVPMAEVSCAGYILLLDRDIRKGDR